MLRILKLALGATCMSLLLTACGGDDDPPLPNVAQVAQQKGFTALVAAATKAGLGGALSDANATLTVFAPTDTAFTQLATQLGFSSADAMVTALPASALANILQYHVLPARKQAADLPAGSSTATTLYRFNNAATTLAVTVSNGVSLQDAALTTARVTTPDVQASNGVIHAIDKVLVPPGVLNIVQMAQVNPLFDTLVSAVVKANLQGALSGAGPLTVFAPTRDAFAAIVGTVNSLTVPQLTSVLTYHVLGSQVLSSGIPFGTPVPTLQGQTITINAGNPPTIKDSTATASRIVATDVRASNGVIHVIDKVLIPTL